MLLNHPKTIPKPLSMEKLPSQNLFLMAESLGTTDLYTISYFICEIFVHLLIHLILMLKFYRIVYLQQKDTKPLPGQANS